MKIIRTFLAFVIFTVAILPIAHSKAQIRTPQNAEYSVTFTSSIDSVNPGDTFNLSLSVENTGATPIDNFEIRIPFNKTIADTTYTGESPSYNKVLSSNAYPSGFNSRSWIINSFNSNSKQTYSLKYSVSSSPTTQNGLVSNFTLPSDWNDPAGLASGQLISQQVMRADIYINNTYDKSVQVTLPTLKALDNPLASVTLNAKFNGSTTDLKKVTSSNIKSFPNFILETSDVKIEWLEPVDLSATNVPSQLSNLDTNLNVSWGKVAFQSVNLPFLNNKKVKVTFKNSNFVFAPKIKVDNEVKDLSDISATFTPSSQIIVLEQNKLTNLAITPEIKVDQAVIESDQDKIEVKGQVSDPRSALIVKIGDKTETLTGIDITNGNFSFKVDVKDGSQQVEISTKYKNDEETKKVVIVRKTNNETTPTPQEESRGTIDAPLNGITLGLLLAALGVLAIIGGIIYYLYRAKKKNTKNTTNIDINPTVLNASKIGSIKDETELNRPAFERKEEKIESSSKTKSVTENLESNTKDKNTSSIDLTNLKKRYETGKEDDVISKE